MSGVRWSKVRLDEPRQLTEIFTKTGRSLQVEFVGHNSCKLHQGSWLRSNSTSGMLLVMAKGGGSNVGLHS